MAATSPATRLVTRAAREVLRPMGLVQKGRSRTWIDDHYWWLIVAEFQPSGFSQGTYLNVGVNWLWRAKPHLSFDYGYRVRWTTTDPIRIAEGDRHTTDFVAYQDERQFDDAVRALCQVAGQRVGELRELFRDMRSTAEELNVHVTADGGWSSYHAGIAAGLAGDTAAAHHQLTSVAAAEPTTSWQKDQIHQARELSELLDDHPTFLARITSTVVTARALLKLEPVVALNLV